MIGNGEKNGQEHSWSPVLRFVGERFLRAGLSSSVPELGSMLEHKGAVAEAEDNAARVFGADDMYFVANGTTMSCAGPSVMALRPCRSPPMHAGCWGGAASAVPSSSR
jgi:arginine/lysine/ornithine decarboxylase